MENPQNAIILIVLVIFAVAALAFVVYVWIYKIAPYRTQPGVRRQPRPTTPAQKAENDEAVMAMKQWIETPRVNR